MDDLETKVNAIGSYILNTLGGKIHFSSNLMGDTVNIRWRKYDSAGRIVDDFIEAIPYVELYNLSDPIAYAQGIIDKYAKPEDKPVALPRSWPEKHQAFKNGHYVEHWIYVWELKELLEHLKADDWLTPNQVDNLSVGRGDDDTFAAIDFHSNHIIFFGKQEDIGLKGE